MDRKKPPRWPIVVLVIVVLAMLAPCVLAFGDAFIHSIGYFTGPHR
jgi:hypothetical protein